MTDPLTLYPFGSMVLIWPENVQSFAAIAGVHGMLGDVPSLEIRGSGGMTLVVPLSMVMPLPARSVPELTPHIHQGGRA